MQVWCNISVSQQSLQRVWLWSWWRLISDARPPHMVHRFEAWLSPRSGLSRSSSSVAMQSGHRSRINQLNYSPYNPRLSSAAPCEPRQDDSISIKLSTAQSYFCEVSATERDKLLTNTAIISTTHTPWVEKWLSKTFVSIFFKSQPLVIMGWLKMMLTQQA